MFLGCVSDSVPTTRSGPAVSFSFYSEGTDTLMMIEAFRIGPSSTLLRVRAVYRFPPFWVNLASDRGVRSGEVIGKIRQLW